MMRYYLLFMNMTAFLVYGWDKYKARREAWRIRESILLILAVLGGSAGAWAGMRLFHHKTRKPLFRFGIPLILAVQILGAIWYIRR